MQRYFIPVIFFLSAFILSHSSISFCETATSTELNEYVSANNDMLSYRAPNPALDEAKTFTTLGGNISDPSPSVASESMYLVLPSGDDGDLDDLTTGCETAGSCISGSVTGGRGAYPLIVASLPRLNNRLQGDIRASNDLLALFYGTKVETIGLYTSNVDFKNFLIKKIGWKASEGTITATNLYNQVTRTLPVINSMIRIFKSDDTCYVFFKRPALTRRLYIPIGSDSEVEAFYQWALTSSYVGAATCPVAGTPTGSNNYVGGGGSPTSGYNPSGGGCTTPFLFTSNNGQFFIENDVLETYKDQDYAAAKKAYESNSGNPLLFKKEDFYKFKMPPEITSTGIKLLIKEIEPEESHIDSVRLVRIIAPNDASVFFDQESNAIKAVYPKTAIAPISCALNDNTDCLGALSKSDETTLETKNNDVLKFNFDRQTIDIRNLYLNIDAWLYSKNKPPEEWKSDLKLSIIDPARPDQPIVLKNVYPRVLKSAKHIYLGDALKNIASPTFTLVVNSQGNHYIDSVVLENNAPAAFKTEELRATSAKHSNGPDVLDKVSSADFTYADLMRSEQLELTMAVPQQKLGDKEKDTYFFAITGFYNMMSADTAKYFRLEPTFNGVYEELTGYVNQTPVQSQK